MPFRFPRKTRMPAEKADGLRRDGDAEKPTDASDIPKKFVDYVDKSVDYSDAPAVVPRFWSAYVFLL